MFAFPSGFYTRTHTHTHTNPPFQLSAFCASLPVFSLLRPTGSICRDLDPRRGKWCFSPLQNSLSSRLAVPGMGVEVVFVWNRIAQPQWFHVKQHRVKLLSCTNSEWEQTYQILTAGSDSSTALMSFFLSLQSNFLFCFVLGKASLCFRWELIYLHYTPDHNKLYKECSCHTCFVNMQLWLGGSSIQLKCCRHIDTTLQGSCSTWKLAPSLGEELDRRCSFKTSIFL